MAIIGLSPGDFYFIARLIGSIVESFRDVPQGAVQQYAAFSAELKLVSQYLDERPREETELGHLWQDTKVQCVAFVTKYGSLGSEAGRDGRNLWDWLCGQSVKAFDTVKWPLSGRTEATELQQKVVRIVHLALLSIGLENRTSLARLEAFLKQVLVDHIEWTKILDKRLDSIQADLRDLKHTIRNPSKGTILWQKIEDVRLQPQTLALMRQATLMAARPRINDAASEHSTEDSASRKSQSESGLPFVAFPRLFKLESFDFDKAVDHLSRLATIMDNLVMRQHGGPPSSGSSIIALIDHIWQTINIALVAIGHKDQDFEYPNAEEDPETALKAALDSWDRFTKRVQYQCKRIANPLPTSTATMLRRSPSGLVAIDENTSPLEFDRAQYDIPAYRSRSRSTRSPVLSYGTDRPESSGDVSSSSKSGITSWNSSQSGGTSTGQFWGSARVILLNSSREEYKWKRLLERCRVTVSHTVASGNESDDYSIIEFKDTDGKVNARHCICEISYPSNIGEAFDKLSSNHSIPMLELYSSYGSLRIIYKDQLPLNYHPSKEPVYVFQTEKECLALQTEILKYPNNGRRVVFSAETKHIAHVRNHHKSCVMNILRILQDSQDQKIISYWTDKRSDTIDGIRRDFVEWHRAEFKSVKPKGNFLAILKFPDEITESGDQQGRRPSLGKRQTSSGEKDRRSSKDELSRTSTWSMTSMFSSSPTNIGITASDTGLSSPSTLTPTIQSVATTSSKAADPKSKYKTSIEGLEITFYTERERDLFIKRFENRNAEAEGKRGQSIDSEKQLERQGRKWSFAKQTGSMMRP